VELLGYEFTKPRENNQPREKQMSKLVSLGLIAAAMFANPAMAAWHDKNGAVVDPSRVVHCIRAPDVGQFAGGPFNNPPCEPATWRSGTNRTNQGTVGMGRGSAGGSNNRGGLVGGADPGTYKP
jgi:hypothetical protein